LRGSKWGGVMRRKARSSKVSKALASGGVIGVSGEVSASRKWPALSRQAVKALDRFRKLRLKINGLFEANLRYSFDIELDIFLNLFLTLLSHNQHKVLSDTGSMMRELDTCAKHDSDPLGSAR
jgi:hypothetical protein